MLYASGSYIVLEELGHVVIVCYDRVQYGVAMMWFRRYIVLFVSQMFVSMTIVAQMLSGTIPSGSNEGCSGSQPPRGSDIQDILLDLNI